MKKYIFLYDAHHVNSSNAYLELTVYHVDRKDVPVAYLHFTFNSLVAHNFRLSPYDFAVVLGKFHDSIIKYLFNNKI